MWPLTPGTHAAHGYGVATVPGAPPPPLRRSNMPTSTNSSAAGLIVSGINPRRNLVEVMELKNHPCSSARRRTRNSSRSQTKRIRSSRRSSRRRSSVGRKEVARTPTGATLATMLFDRRNPPHRRPLLARDERVLPHCRRALVFLRAHQPELNIVFKGAFDKANRTSLAGAARHRTRGRTRVARDGEKKIYASRCSATCTRRASARGCRVCEWCKSPRPLPPDGLLLAARRLAASVNVEEGSVSFAAGNAVRPWKAPGKERRRKSGRTERGTTLATKISSSTCARHDHAAKRLPTVLDATAGGAAARRGGRKSAGQREFVPPLALAAPAAGADVCSRNASRPGARDPGTAEYDPVARVARPHRLVSGGVWKRCGLGRCFRSPSLTAAFRRPHFRHKTADGNYYHYVPMPSMGATVNELTVITSKRSPATRVTKGPAARRPRERQVGFRIRIALRRHGCARSFANRDVIPVGATFLRKETSDQSSASRSQGSGGRSHPRPWRHRNPAAALVWTPPCGQNVQEARLDPTKHPGIEATGPGRAGVATMCQLSGQGGKKNKRWRGAGGAFE